MKIEIKPTLVGAAVTKANQLVSMVVPVQDQLGLKRLRFRELSPLNVHYSFEQFGVNGRKWDQDITFDSPTPNEDPLMNFTVPDYWRETEFSQLRAIRELMIEMYVQYSITEIDFQW